MISPLQLTLDERNPRFKVVVETSQEDIRTYMLSNEDLLGLAKKMNDMGELLPGERIIITKEDDGYVVLEGNRRVAIYQMFLNRDLVPREYRKQFPFPNREFQAAIDLIPVDIVESREKAMPFLAARHIEGVKQWSSVSKWRISYNYHAERKPLHEIAEILILSHSDIRKFICNYKILLRGITSDTWKAHEKEKLTLLNIEPDKLIRILRSRATASLLNLYFNEEFDLVSNTSFITKERLDQLIVEFSRKAFIDNTLNTRSTIHDDDIMTLVEHVFPELLENDLESDPEDQAQGKDRREGDSESHSGFKAASDRIESETPVQDVRSSPPQKPTARQLPYFFEGLDFSRLDKDEHQSHGLLLTCKEVSAFSSKRLVQQLPICATLLTRCLVEQSIVYYAKKTRIVGRDTFIWDEITPNGKSTSLSTIVKKFCRDGSAPNYITDDNIRGYFLKIFSNYNIFANPLNWVIHNPGEFTISAEELIELPRQGLVAIINYFMS